MKTENIEVDSKATCVSLYEHERRLILKSMLTRERADAISRITVFRREEAEDATQPPGDEMDTARAIGEVETQARLIERAHQRLRDVENAIERLAQGSYGICVDCGEEIPMARLQAAPCAMRCLECQQRSSRRVPAGIEARMGVTPAGWPASGEVAGSTNPIETILAAKEPNSLDFESPFGPEEGAPPREENRRKRGRPRKTGEHGGRAMR